MKIEEFAVDGQFTVIRGNLPEGENATRQAIITAVNPKTILDAEQMMLSHDSAEALMDKLRDLAFQLNVKLVLHDGIVYCSEVIDGALELVRQDRQVDKMVTHAYNFGVKHGATSRSLRSRPSPFENFPANLFTESEDPSIEVVKVKDWKQTRLRKGAGHNKHSRKGKK